MKKTTNKEKKKSTSKRKKVTVQELKQNETKYTYLFAGMFVALFVYLGYTFIAVPEEDVVEKFQTATTTINEVGKDAPVSNVSFFSDVVSLDEESRMTEEEGKRTDPYSVTIENNSGDEIQYHLNLVKDHFLESKCGCSNDYASYVWVSINGTTKKLSDFKDGIVFEDTLLNGEFAELTFFIWFDENLSVEEDDVHFHGRFEVEY